jgi:hypothetical protein
MVIIHKVSDPVTVLQNGHHQAYGQGADTGQGHAELPFPAQQQGGGEAEQRADDDIVVHARVPSGNRQVEPWQST